MKLTLVMLNLDIPCLYNSADPDRFLKKPTDLDLDLHCLPLNITRLSYTMVRAHVRYDNARA